MVVMSPGRHTHTHTNMVQKYRYKVCVRTCVRACLHGHTWHFLWFIGYILHFSGALHPHCNVSPITLFPRWLKKKRNQTANKGSECALTTTCHAEHARNNTGQSRTGIPLVTQVTYGGKRSIQQFPLNFFYEIAPVTEACDCVTNIAVIIASLLLQSGGGCCSCPCIIKTAMQGPGGVLLFG